MKPIKMYITVTLAALLLLAGCGTGTSWVYSSGGVTVSAGAYINNIIEALAELETADRESFALTNPGESYEMPKLRSFLRQTAANGLTYSQKAVIGAQERSRRFIAVELLFSQMGLSLSESEQNLLDYYSESIYGQSREVLERNGIGEHSIRALQGNSMKREKLFMTMYDEGGERAVPDEELISLFLSKYLRYEMMYIFTDNITGDPDYNAAGVAAAFAQDFLDRYKSGEALEDLQYEYELYMAQYSGTLEEDIEKAGPDELVGVMELDEATRQDEVVKAILAVSDGEVGMIEHAGYIILFKRLALMEHEGLFASVRFTLLTEMKGGEFEDYINDYANSLEVDVNEASVRRYTPEKLKLD